jgi:hypothetical protein
MYNYQERWYALWPQRTYQINLFSKGTEKGNGSETFKFNFQTNETNIFFYFYFLLFIESLNLSDLCNKRNAAFSPLAIISSHFYILKT